MKASFTSLPVTHFAAITALCASTLSKTAWTTGGLVLRLNLVSLTPLIAVLLRGDGRSRAYLLHRSLLELFRLSHPHRVRGDPDAHPDPAEAQPDDQHHRQHALNLG